MEEAHRYRVVACWVPECYRIYYIECSGICANARRRCHDICNTEFRSGIDNGDVVGNVCMWNTIGGSHGV